MTPLILIIVIGVITVYLVLEQELNWQRCKEKWKKKIKSKADKKSSFKKKGTNQNH